MKITILGNHNTRIANVAHCCTYVSFYPQYHLSLLCTRSMALNISLHSSSSVSSLQMSLPQSMVPCAEKTVTTSPSEVFCLGSLRSTIQHSLFTAKPEEPKKGLQYSYCLCTDFRDTPASTIQQIIVVSMIKI